MTKEAIAPMSPEEFFKSERKKDKCHVCLAPFREDIERCQANGMPSAALGRWAKKVHPEYPIGDDALRRHLNGGHAAR